MVMSGFHMVTGCFYYRFNNFRLRDDAILDVFTIGSFKFCVFAGLQAIIKGISVGSINLTICISIPFTTITGI